MQRLQSVPQFIQRRPFWSRRPLLFASEDGIRHIRVNLFSIFEIEPEHFVNERQRESRILSEKHFCGEAIVVAKHNVFDTNSMFGDMDVSIAILLQKIGKFHGDRAEVETFICKRTATIILTRKP